MKYWVLVFLELLVYTITCLIVYFYKCDAILSGLTGFAIMCLIGEVWQIATQEGKRKKKKNKWFLHGGRESGRTFRLLCDAYENKIAELDMKRKAEKQIFQGIVEKKNWQLTKAKEIINEFVEWANWQGNNCPSFKSIQDKAEQFLSEVKK